MMKTAYKISHLLDQLDVAKPLVYDDGVVRNTSIFPEKPFSYNQHKEEFLLRLQDIEAQMNALSDEIHDL